MAGYDEPEHRAWWEAREQAYRNRPEVQAAIAAHEAAWTAELEQDQAGQAQPEEQGRPGPQEPPPRAPAFPGPPRIPSARDDAAEWEAFFREFYGRDLPLNAARQASLNRPGPDAPPGGYDDAELTAERLGVTVAELLGSQGAGPAVHLEQGAYSDQVRDIVARVRRDAPAPGEVPPGVYLYPGPAEASLAAARGSIPPGCVGYVPGDGRAWVQLPGGRQADASGILDSPGLRQYAGAARVARALTDHGPVPGAVTAGQPASPARAGEIAFPAPAAGRPAPAAGIRPRGRPRLGRGMLRPDRRGRG
jgi:hypothetical protein